MKMPLTRCFLPALALLSLASPPVAARSIPLSPEFLAAEQKYALLYRAGLDAARAHDYADAAIDIRRAIRVNVPIFPTVYADLGLALDYQGKQNEAFTSYQKAFGDPSNPLLSTMGGPSVLEAIARYGLLCENRRQQAAAVNCFNKALIGEAGGLYNSVDPKTASPSLVRALLTDVWAAALDAEASFGQDRHAEALKAYRSAAKLAPNDPRPQLFLANGLRHAGDFVEAETVLQKVPRLDKSGELKLWTKDSLTATKGHDVWQ